MALLVFVAGGVVLAIALSALLRRLRGARNIEGDDTLWLLDAGASAFLLTFAVLVAESWVFALSHLLAAPALIACSIVNLVAGLLLLLRLGAFKSRTFASGDRWTLAASAIALAPALSWTAFVAWRGTILPVYNHDGLAYHLPRAVLLMKGHGFHVLDIAEARIATWPCDFELLLSDTLILAGNDHFTAAVATLAYVGLALFAARLAAGWWGGGAHVAIVAALTLAAPIAVLHSGLHKNDLLTAVFVLAALVWGARFFAVGCTSAAALACIALLLGIGTKLSGLLVAVPVAVVLLAGAWRHRASLSRSFVVSFVAGSIVGAILLGVWPYVVNLATLHKLALPPQQPGGGEYGDWSNIWQYTAMVIIRPFGSPDFVWNPFRGGMWWWASNDVWMSHFGAVFSVLIVALVPCVIVFRKTGARIERNAASLAALAIYLLVLPLHTLPIGFFSSYARYVVFVLPVVAAWTVSPLVMRIDLRAGRARAPALVAVALLAAVATTKSFIDFGLHDAYAPLAYVESMIEHPDSRLPFVRQNRAASAFDSFAGPNETVAFDLGFDTWVYPAYGAAFTRNVEFLKPTPGEVAIPDDAGWIIVDRTWNIFFGNPGFVDMTKAYLIGQGKPTDDDLKVYRQLRKDPRFELVYADRSQNQALFPRKAVAATPPAP
jgi:hypothetical protein